MAQPICETCFPAPPLNCAAEPDASLIQNFISLILGSVTKVSVNGQCVWTLPCNLSGEIPGFPRLVGEGVMCYIFRIFTITSGLTGVTTIQNVGAGSGDIFRDLVGPLASFRSVVQGLNISVTQQADTITIDFLYAAVPATNADAGTKGQVAFDDSFLYICVETNTWRRCALGSW